jgi:multidrug efflux pump subunit AcrA (membrane-fusion protein)
MSASFQILAITATALLLWGCKPKYTEVQPKMAPVTEAVFASGSIAPKDAYTLNSLYDGYMVAAYVTENDYVQQGQLLFRLDNKQQNTQVAVARANLAYATTNAAIGSPQLAQLRAQASAAAAKQGNDSAILARMERLLVTHSVSVQDVDNARLAYQTSVNNHIAAMEAVAFAASRVRQDLSVSQAQLQNAAAGNQYYDLSALSNGKVYQVFKRQGDLVRKGDQVAKLGNPDSMVIDLDVDEGSINKIKVGQKVLVELNTQKDHPYEASVTKIYPNFNETAQSYHVEARFVAQVPMLISGTQLQANIVTQTKPKALLVPGNYVFGTGKVLVKRGNRYDTVAIQKGIVSEEWVEVLSGLSETETIAKQK